MFSKMPSSVQSPLSSQYLPAVTLTLRGTLLPSRKEPGVHLELEMSKTVRMRYVHGVAYSTLSRLYYCNVSHHFPLHFPLFLFISHFAAYFTLTFISPFIMPFTSLFTSYSTPSLSPYNFQAYLYLPHDLKRSPSSSRWCHDNTNQNTAAEDENSSRWTNTRPPRSVHAFRHSLLQVFFL
jgi:hypothetical protein